MLMSRGQHDCTGGIDDIVENRAAARRALAGDAEIMAAVDGDKAAGGELPAFQDRRSGHDVAIFLRSVRACLLPGRGKETADL